MLPRRYKRLVRKVCRLMVRHTLVGLLLAMIPAMIEMQVLNIIVLALVVGVGNGIGILYFIVYYIRHLRPQHPRRIRAWYLDKGVLFEGHADGLTFYPNSPNKCGFDAQVFSPNDIGKCVFYDLYEAYKVCDRVEVVE